MKIDTIVTLDGNEKYYLSLETIQDNNKYFLALKVDENDEPLDESKIFLEEVDGDNYFLTEVEDEDILKYLGAVFVTRFNENIDKLNEED